MGISVFIFKMGSIRMSATYALNKYIFSLCFKIHRHLILHLKPNIRYFCELPPNFVIEKGPTKLKGQIDRT